MKIVKIARKFFLILFFLIIIFFIKCLYKNIKNENKNNKTSININKKLTTENNHKIQQKINDILNNNKIGNVCIVTISNYGYKELVLNWIYSLSKINYNKFVIFSFDIELINFLNEKGFVNKTILVPKHWINLNISKDSSIWLNEKFNQITQAKVKICYELLKLNQNILYSDSDLVFLNKNIIFHIEFIFEYSLAEIIFSQDQLSNTLCYNTGLFYAKSTLFVKNLFSRLIKMMERDPVNSIDQLVLEKLLSETKYNDSRIGGLDPFLFASGNVYILMKMNEYLNLTPYTIHANYIFGKENKINALKSIGYWLY